MDTRFIGFIKYVIYLVVASRRQAIHGHGQPLEYVGGSEESRLATSSHKFWWKTTGRPLARMLEWASYPLPTRNSYLSFYSQHIIPEFGLFLPASDSSEPFEPSLASALPDQKIFPSYMTDDHTPIEFSCIFDDGGIPTIRFSVDPVRRQESSDGLAIGFFEDIARVMPSPAPQDLTWCRLCAEELTVARRDHKGPPLIKPRYPSQYFAGIELSKSNTTLKAYFLPEMSALITGVVKFDLITRVVKRISQDPSLYSTSGLQQAWGLLLEFFRSLPQNLAPSIEIVAVDCVPSSKNRLKVYVRTPLTTLSAVKQFMTLGFAVDSAEITETLEQASYFWRILFPGISDDEEPTVGGDRLRHPTSGLLFYYELRASSLYPLPKIYIPVRHLCKSDEEIIGAMEKLYRKMNNLEAMRNYGKLIRDAFDHRPLSTRTGIHTYITFAAKSSKVEITAYFNPECFRRG
ncbi:aromatic prenyltransferase [Collybia nuda]|uniref:Aromatic prenyltransferase n=1 Tax=Collybia nuda TaxID=64659 RepID=A0A9P6CJA4_9AGAR|nr:aromatic prenyltransferase [Collybia nuda]